MKRLFLFAMIVVYILGWYVTGTTYVERPQEYASLIAEAEAYESKEIYTKAIQAYEEALQYSTDALAIQIRIAKDYQKLGDETSFIARCNSINASYGYPLESVTLLADFYMENQRDEKAIDLLTSAMKKHKDEAELQSRYEKLRYTYQDLYVRYDEIFNFRNGSAVYRENELYGLVNTKGKTMLRSYNDAVGTLSGKNDLIPVCKQGEYYYADTKGYRSEVPREDQHIEELGVLCDGIAPAKINGGYGYINEKFEEQTSFDWDAVTVIEHGVGAVCSGGAWALINEKYELITDYIYEDVKMDEERYASTAGRLFVMQGGAWYMLDETGNRVGSLVLEDAVPFVSEEPTAVKIGGLWGFADRDGALVIEPQYEEAGAFSEHLAPVLTNTGWGYINLEQEFVIEAKYDGARNFQNGSAPVKKGSKWTIIQLNVR